MTPGEALADIRGHAQAGRVEFTGHAVLRARQRGVRIGEAVTALAYAHGCRHDEDEKWRALCRDRDGDLLELIVAIEDGLLVVTLFQESIMRRCHKCKGTDIRRVRDRFVEKLPLTNGRTLEFVFEDFPQRVCSSCGERYYEAKDLIKAEDAVTRELVARGIRDGEVFKYLRKALGLKATELADLLGVTAETISRWENGHNEADRAVWATLDLLVDDHYAGRTTTLDRLRGLAEARIPKRPVPLTLARARG